MHKILGSSQDSNKLALRVKSILLGLIPLVMVISGLAGWDIGEEALHNLVEMIIDGVVAGTALVAVGQQIWGWIRAIKK